MIYVMSDMNLNDNLVAAFEKMSIEDWNNKIITNWNSVVTDDDKVLVFGTLAKGLGKEVKPLIEQLNGMIYMCDYPANKHFKPDRWKRLGVDVVWSTSIEKTLEGGDKVLIPVSQQIVDDPKVWNEMAPPKGFKWDKSKYKYLCLSAKYGLNEVFKKNCLSIEPKYWDYTPIALDDLPQIIENMKTFESMEEN